MTQCERLKAFLIARPGSTIMQITLGLHPFVANPRARISDLRKQGESEGFAVIREKRPDGLDGYAVVPVGQATLGLTA